MALPSQGVVDLHIHVQPWHDMPEAVRRQMWKDEATAERMRALSEDPRVLLAFLDGEGVERAAVINYVAPRVMGFTSRVNPWVSAYCARAKDRLIPVGCIDPLSSRDPAGDMDELLGPLGIRMVKVHPPHQLLHPNAYLDGLDAQRVIYEKCQARGVPVMFHTGTSIFHGARIKYGDPVHLDDVAVDFPDLKIVLAHGGRPLWMETCFYLLRRHRNTWLDISGIPPRSLLTYFPRLGEVADRTVFGTDWPSPGVRSIAANAREVDALPLPDEAKAGIFRGNALKLLGIET